MPLATTRPSATSRNPAHVDDATVAPTSVSDSWPERRTNVHPTQMSVSRSMTSLAVSHRDEPQGLEPAVAGLVAEYAEYVRAEHTICGACPVVRSGVAIVRSMLEWKAIHGDGRPERWTRRDIRDYLLHYLPTANVRRVLLTDAPTCAKDLVYFLADRGTLVGDDAGVLAEATDEVFYGYVRPGTGVVSRSTRSPGADRRAKRKAAGQARKRNRRTR
jgi:hypothetical protein